MARHFGFQGRLRVEEVLIRQGETVQACGVLFDPAASGSAGPFRATHTSAELCDATIKLPTGISLRPALLPWALGTAAALLTTASAVGTLSKLRKMRLDHVGAAGRDRPGQDSPPALALRPAPGRTGADGLW